MAAEPDSIAAELRALDRLMPVLEAATGDGVYVVGGIVRDALLGRPSLDVDLVVEGDALPVARRLAEALEGELTTHGRFGTAVVDRGDGTHVDVVTARRESYPGPAALPEVEPGTIEDDLRRRDFTINALAASLAPGSFGLLVDPCGGLGDLARETIRVLHDRSFVDDPTRILRAIRYESRFGFRMDAGTEALARAAVGDGLLARLSPVRLGDELVTLLAEDDVVDSFARLDDLGVDRAVHPSFAGGAEAAGLAVRLAALQDELAVDAPAWRLRLAVLARGVPGGPLEALLDGFGLRRRDVQLVVAAVTQAPELVARLAGSPDPAEVVALADPGAPDSPLFALALADLPALRSYFTTLRDVRLDVDGSDLAALGLAESPRVGEVLAELRRRKLRGDIGGRDAELAAARELIGE